MSIADVLTAVCPDRAIVETLTVSLVENGISTLKLLENIRESPVLCDTVLSPFSTLPLPLALVDKAPLARAALNAAVAEASAQLQYAVSTTAANAKESTPPPRVSYSAALSQLRDTLGGIPFVPSQRLLDAIHRGGLSVYVDFTSSLVSDSGSNSAANGRDAEIALSVSGDPVLVQAGFSGTSPSGEADDKRKLWADQPTGVSGEVISPQAATIPKA
ncbi:hypothetical protein FOZ63_006237, partial [Perkinsus olseni]